MTRHRWDYNQRRTAACLAIIVAPLVLIPLAIWVLS